MLFQLLINKISLILRDTIVSHGWEEAVKSYFRKNISKNILPVNVTTIARINDSSCNVRSNLINFCANLNRCSTNLSGKKLLISWNMYSLPQGVKRTFFSKFTLRHICLYAPRIVLSNRDAENINNHVSLILKFLHFITMKTI